MTERIDPVRPTDEEARGTARSLLRTARIAALAFTHPNTGGPFVALVGFGLSPSGEPVTLVSDLSLHTRALRANPNAALLVGEPGDRGDPLNHPRISIAVIGRFVDRSSTERELLRQAWLDTHPKAKLYIDFADFSFVVFDIKFAALNGGFGKAYVLNRADLVLP